MAKRAKRKANLDDGFNHELVRGAVFDGAFEIPHIFSSENIIVPDGFTPFKQRHRAPSEAEALCFFEKDPSFSEVIIHPEQFVDEFASFPIVVPPDCSAYRDAPLLVQIANIYRSRALGSFFQRNGSNVYPLVRWGDERTYTTSVLDEKIAFVGIEKHSPVVISTYGCIDSSEDKRYFRDGLKEMLLTLEPSLVLVHGAAPDCVFAGLTSSTDFVQFPDWITRMKRGE